MNGYLRVFSIAAVLAIAACNGGGSSNVATGGLPPQSAQPASSHFVPQWEAKHQAHRVCKLLEGGVQCQVLLIGKAQQPPCSPSSTCGWIPKDLQTRYNLTGSLGKGSGQIVALIELGDLPSAQTDLQTYRTQFGLGTAPFTKYNEEGQQKNYPPSCQNYGWCLESDLDSEMAAAVCPKCTIYMIEGGNCGGVVCGLEKAEATAVSLGATILSNSWGCSSFNYGENCGDSNFPNYFNTPGVAYVAASGDYGYNIILWPAALANVLAVGGTQLEKSGSNYTETVWDGAGSGCATTTTKPSWQHDPDCAGRTIADISAEAGCSPGVAEYVTTYGGWTDVCGTSAATPMTAGIIALAGNSSSIMGGKTFWELRRSQRHRQLHAITSGSNGSCNNYLCQAGLSAQNGGYKKYSGPAGWGTPNGIKAY